MITIENLTTQLKITYGPGRVGIYSKTKIAETIDVRNGIVSFLEGANKVKLDYRQVSDPACASAELLADVISGYCADPSLYRTATVAVVEGANTITFSTPLSTSSYEIIAWGDVSGNPSAYTVNGFTFTAIGAGEITYLAIITA